MVAFALFWLPHQPQRGMPAGILANWRVRRQCSRSKPYPPPRWVGASYSATTHCSTASLQAGSLTLEQCDITSRSGVGVGVEGAAVSLKSCHIHDCERHGVAVFGSLEGEGSGGTPCSVLKMNTGLCACK